MLIHQVVPTLQRRSTIFRGFARLMSNVPRNDKLISENIESKRKLKEWRRKPDKVPESALRIFNWGNNNDDNFWVGTTRFVKPTELKYWWRNKQQEYVVWSQRFIFERHQTLGHHLATTHFILHRNGRVRQKDCAQFLTKDDINNIPSNFNPTWLIEEIELINSEICYEGIENFQELRTLKRVTFKDCEFFDNWALERLLCLCPNLEYLNVSGCKKITERGLEGVYRTWNLKHLIVTDFNHTASFELTCMLLEDCMPDLKVEIIKIPKMIGDVNEIKVEL